MPRPNSVETVGIYSALVPPTATSDSEQQSPISDAVPPRPTSPLGDFVLGAPTVGDYVVGGGVGLQMENLENHFSHLSDTIRNDNYEGLTSFLSKNGVKVKIVPKVGCSEMHYSKFNIANSHGPDR